MEIVIKIPDEMYDAIMQDTESEMYIIDVIKHGTPLPKGHGRLIDISEYEDNYFNAAIQYDDGDRTHEKYTFVIPTIIEAEKGAEK